MEVWGWRAGGPPALPAPHAAQQVIKTSARLSPSIKSGSLPPRSPAIFASICCSDSFREISLTTTPLSSHSMSTGRFPSSRASVLICL